MQEYFLCQDRSGACPRGKDHVRTRYKIRNVGFRRPAVKGRERASGGRCRRTFPALGNEFIGSMKGAFTLTRDNQYVLDLIQRAGLVTPAQVEAAKKTAAESPARISVVDALVTMKAISEDRKSVV